MHVYEKPVRRVAWLLGFIDLRELLPHWAGTRPGEEILTYFARFCASTNSDKLSDLD
jgi:hypothetical protein